METTLEARKELSSFIFVEADLSEAETLEWLPELESLFAEHNAKPLRRPKSSAIRQSESEDEVDAHLAQLALEEGDAIPYDDFRKELGLED